MGRQQQAERVPLLTSLRQLLPREPVDLATLLALVDTLAAHMRKASEHDGDHFPEHTVVRQPSIRVEPTKRPVSAYTFWNGRQHPGHWVIRLNRDEPLTERRFTLLHEFGHIIWHHAVDHLFPDMAPHNQQRLAEHAADRFASEVLIPARRLRELYLAGERDIAALAERFGVSHQTIRWKLAQTDLVTETIQNDGGADASHDNT